LNNLPKNWQELEVSKVIESIPLSGKKIKQKDYQNTGILPVIDQGKKLIGGYTDKQECKIAVKKPVTVFGDHTRIVKYIDFDFAPGADGIKVLKPNELFLPKLFYYFLKTVKIPNKGYSRHFKFLKTSKISIPPIPIQKQLIPILDKVEEIKQKNTEILNSINPFIYSIFQKMFGDPINNTKGWDECPMSEVLDDVQYGTSSSLDKEHGTPCLRMNNLTSNGWFDLSDLKYLKEDEDKEKLLLHKGDILFNRTNSRDLVGKTSLFDLDGEFTFAGYLIRLVTEPKKCNPFFLRTFMNMPSIKEKIKSMAIGSVNQANINATKIQTLTIFKPPIKLQNKFQETFSEIETLMKSKQAIYENIKELSITLSKKAFQGELIA